MTTKTPTLADLRRARGWTQGELARLMGTRQSHVSEWESGARTPSFPTIRRLAILYGVD